MTWYDLTYGSYTYLLYHDLKTANACNTTQFADTAKELMPLSTKSSIKRLEQWFGTPLFHKKKRRITMNEYGEYFLGQCNKMMGGWDAEDPYHVGWRHEIDRTLKVLEAHSMTQPMNQKNKRPLSVNVFLCMYDMVSGPDIESVLRAYNFPKYYNMTMDYAFNNAWRAKLITRDGEHMKKTLAGVHVWPMIEDYATVLRQILRIRNALRNAPTIDKP